MALPGFIEGVDGGVEAASRHNPIKGLCPISARMRKARALPSTRKGSETL